MTSQLSLSFPLCAALVLAGATPLAAQNITGNDLTLSGDITQNGFGPNYFGAGNNIFDGRACIGGACDGTEPFEQGPLRLKWSEPDILFEDSSSTGGISSNDWRLVINDSGITKFAVQDIDGGTIPFTIEGGVPSNTLWLDQTGRIGMGTTIPQQNIHIITDSGTAAIRLEDTFGTRGAWDVSANNNNFFIHDDTNNKFPFYIEDNAPNNALYVEDTGNVGVGTNAPEGKLHTKGDGVQLAYFESGDGGPVQVRFRTDSQNRRFLAVNNANEVKSQIIFKDNEIQFTGATDSGANRWLTIGPSGIVSQGPTCNPGPCDRTFDRDFFTVPPIAERAALMWEQQHLPAIGPTQPYAPINLTEKMGGVIHELEVAHIYIEQLHAQLASAQARLDAQSAAIAELTAWRAQTDGAMLP